MEFDTMTTENDADGYVQPPHGNNDKRYDDYMAEVRQFGRDEGDGKRAKARFFVRTVQAAADGLVDETKNKHGKDVDDAKVLYAEYLKAKSRKTMEESAG